LEAAVVQLCAWRELTSTEVADYLGRNKKYIQVNFLIPLSDSGRLMRKFPDIKNHPQQAYRASESQEGTR
jgi:ATP-dependent DNA helicase RecG